MISRNIYPELIKAMPAKQVIVITGMRRVGKTTATKFLLDKIKSTNKLYFDLERIEYRYIFNDSNYKNIVQSLEVEGLDLNSKAYIAIDEIQLVPNISSVIKYLYDTYNIKFIVTGSSSFYIKNHFSESLAGRKFIFELYSLSFDEFLRFKNIKVKTTLYKFNISFYNKYYNHYLEYIEFGGFPEVVLQKNKKLKIALLKDIINSYMRIDIKFFTDFSKTDELYKILKLLTSRTGSKTDYTKLSGITGVDRKTIKEYLIFFEQTYILKLVPAFVKNIDREIALQYKIYFADNGLLNVLGNPSLGALLENAVANQLLAKGEIQYYAKKSGQEIDFILNKQSAFEVKETPQAGDVNILKRRSQSIGIMECHVVGLNYSNKEFTDFIWAGNIF